MNTHSAIRSFKPKRSSNDAATRIPINTVPFLLTGPDKWAQWRRSLRVICEDYDLWKYVEAPEGSDEPLPLPPGPGQPERLYLPGGCDDAQLQLRLELQRVRQADWANENIIFARYETANHAVMEFIRSTVDPRILTQVRRQPNLPSTLRALEDRLRLPPDVWEALYRGRLSDHCAAVAKNHGKMDKAELDRWIDDYEILLQDCVDVGILELTSDRWQVTNFLVSLQAIEPAFCRLKLAEYGITPYEKDRRCPPVWDVIKAFKFTRRE